MSARRLASVVAATALFGTVVGLSSARPSATLAATAMPAHVYSPYFETWTTDSITTIAQQSGVRYFTLAFLETLSKTSCTLAWNGDSARTITANPVPYLADIQSLRGLGGDVTLSFGGWSADQGGTEIGDSCANVNTMAAAYEQVITTYDVSRLDMDIEGRSLTKTTGIDNRNKAIKLLQDWATAHGRPLTISYTIPTGASGLEASGKAVLSNAYANGVRNYIVQPMVFDYYDRVTTDMGTAAINAVTGAESYLKSLEGITDAAAWPRMGATIMNGIDDYPKKTEVTTLAHTTQLFNFAKSKGMAVLSMWAIQRDNGGCPGNGGANNCSGIVQNTWDFSKILIPYTS
jgi:Glycosyl hydrolases family 18